MTLYGIVGGLEWTRDHWASDAVKAKLQFVPNLTWWGWMIGALVLLVFVTLEGAYRVLQQKETTFNQAVAALSMRLATLEARRPRLVLDYHIFRNLNPSIDSWRDPAQGHEPLFVRNDGEETALNVSLTGEDFNGLPVSFFPKATHLKAGEELSVQMYQQERVDTALEMMFSPVLTQRLKNGEPAPLWERIPIIVHYQDFGCAKSYEGRYDVIGGLQPLGGNKVGFARIRVEATPELAPGVKP